MTQAVERADAIVVGARCAGSAAATALARAGRRVIALEQARLPADTLSTHLLWPAGVAELQALGALPRVSALGAPRLPRALAAGAGFEVRGDYSAVDGIDYALCVRRTGLDAALAQTAAAAGAEIRDGVRVTELVWAGGRVAGVRHRGPDGATRELRAPLVIGADGRRSTVARAVGAAEPYRSCASGRACYFAYWREDRTQHEDRRQVAAQWREGPELGTAFPCDGGLTLVLVQPPVARIPEFREDLAGAYRRTIAGIPGLARRLRDGHLEGKVRSATGLCSYFRRSAGPGWALAGDAGHFKDPVTAQGIRDALRYGRLLGEAAAPVLEDPRALDRALAGWERGREQQCLEIYQWTNTLARGEPMTPLEVELYRSAQADPALARAMLDVFSRTTRPTRVLAPRRVALLTARALLRPGQRRHALHATGRELRTAWSDGRERARSPR